MEKGDAARSVNDLFGAGHEVTVATDAFAARVVLERQVDGVALLLRSFHRHGLHPLKSIINTIL